MVRLGKRRVVELHGRRNQPVWVCKVLGQDQASEVVHVRRLSQIGQVFFCVVGWEFCGQDFGERRKLELQNYLRVLVRMWLLWKIAVRLLDIVMVRGLKGARINV